MAKDALRVATSQTLALAARLTGAADRRVEAARVWAGLPTRADLGRLTARLAALHAAADSLR